MKNKVIKPSWLSVILLPGCIPYSIVFENFSAHLKSNHRDRKIDYEKSKAGPLKKGVFWNTLELHLNDEDVVYLKGLNDKKANEISIILKERSEHLSSLRSELSIISNQINIEAGWLICAINGDFWIAQFDLENRLARCKQFEKYFYLHDEIISGLENTIGNLNLIKDSYLHPPVFKDKCNEVFKTKELIRYKTFFDQVEKHPLTNEQRLAIITNEDSTLVIASAGSGKTSLLVGKVGYLVSKGFAKPEEIILLAFNRKAKEEIEERIKDRLGFECEAQTFHSFGLATIGITTGRMPSLATFVESRHAYSAFMNKLVNNELIKLEHAEIISEHFVSFHRPYKDQFDFKSLGEYFEYLKANKPITLKGEAVRSLEELEICNFLYINGIKYEYEKTYEHDTATSLKRQYKPDFYLPEYKIYIEHFAIDKNNRTPPFIKQEQYLNSIEWKRGLHEEHETVLIETYSYQKREGKLTSALEKKLKNYGVQFKPISPDHLLDSLNEQGYVSEFSQLCTTFLDLFKGRGITFSEFKNSLDLEKVDKDRVLSFLRLFESLFSNYEQNLKNDKTIDFHDMIHEASNLIESGRYESKYKFLLVDEFQDISEGRARILHSLQKNTPTIKFLAVGDDWQSIYRFTGSDISIMTNFMKYFGFTKQLFLSETFRFNNQIEKVASKFVQKNPNQIKKNIQTNIKSNKPEVILFLPTKNTGRYLENIAKEISENSSSQPLSVLILGRYNHTGEGIDFSALKEAAPNCTFEFNTVHAAKGREADFVILLDLKSGRVGFPNEIIDDPIITSMLSQGESYPHSEERRLFYVAITRAKKAVYLIGDTSSASDFFNELATNDYEVEKRNLGHYYDRICPECKTGRVLEKQGPNGIFFGCEHFPLCAYTTNVCKACGIGYLKKEKDRFNCDNNLCKNSIKACPVCNSGMVIEKNGRYGIFYGCSNYSSHGCNHTTKNK